MRIAIVTESFLPTANGVTTSVCRILEHLHRHGHEAMVIAPGTSAPAVAEHAGARVTRLPAVSVRAFPVGVPTPSLAHTLTRFAPHVVHAASPFVLGARALTFTQLRGIPSVAIYQTDVPAYLAQHGPGALGRGASRAAWQWVRRLHARADLTLAPSRPTLETLVAQGIPRTALWARGVDSELFHPDRRSRPEVAALRARFAPHGETIVGYVGRLAPEKELHRLHEIADLPGMQLVIVGDGPTREALERSLPRAHFLGRLDGTELADAYAAFDTFVHTGTMETFGQTLQEAAATGLPVIAPARGGPLDLVAHGRTGFLFDPDQPGALTAALTPLLLDSATRARMGTAGRRFVANRSWAALTDELLGHYDTVLDRGFALAS